MAGDTRRSDLEASADDQRCAALEAKLPFSEANSINDLIPANSVPANGEFPRGSPPESIGT